MLSGLVNFIGGKDGQETAKVSSIHA